MYSGKQPKGSRSHGFQGLVFVFPFPVWERLKCVWPPIKISHTLVDILFQRLSHHREPSQNEKKIFSNIIKTSMFFSSFECQVLLECPHWLANIVRAIFNSAETETHTHTKRNVVKVYFYIQNSLAENAGEFIQLAIYRAGTGINFLRLLWTMHGLCWEGNKCSVDRMRMSLEQSCSVCFEQTLKVLSHIYIQGKTCEHTPALCCTLPTKSSNSKGLKEPRGI